MQWKSLMWGTFIMKADHSTCQPPVSHQPGQSTCLTQVHNPACSRAAMSTSTPRKSCKCSFHALSSQKLRIPHACHQPAYRKCLTHVQNPACSQAQLGWQCQRNGHQSWWALLSHNLSTPHASQQTAMAPLPLVDSDCQLPLKRIHRAATPPRSAAAPLQLMPGNPSPGGVMMAGVKHIYSRGSSCRFWL